MRKDDGRKLSHATLEEMRIRAVKRVEAGESPEDINPHAGLFAPPHLRVVGGVSGRRD